MGTASGAGQEEPSRHPRKKALLIGINYVNVDCEPDMELSGPHHDVLEMKKFLMSVYKFAEADITLMLDGVGDKKHEPNRPNMMREIRHFVKGTVAGDQLFFHFAGHSTQIENRTGTESDGRDEAIVLSDSKKVIVDNELRKRLVNHLPLGSILIAVFDTCHSGSILDLEHIRCNRVYVPWINKGERDPDPIRNSIVRRGDIDYVRKSTSESARRRRSTKETTTSPNAIETDRHPCDPTTITESELCASPVTRVCEGWCANNWMGGAEKKPLVLCFSAAKDRQLSWENESESMTTAFIDVLEKNPDSSLKELMTRISHKIHRLSLQLHDAARLKRLLEMQDDADPVLKELPELEMNNFQNPQLSSHEPLDLERRFPLLAG